MGMQIWIPGSQAYTNDSKHMTLLSKARRTSKQDLNIKDSHTHTHMNTHEEELLLELLWLDELELLELKP